MENKGYLAEAFIEILQSGLRIDLYTLALTNSDEFVKELQAYHGKKKDFFVIHGYKGPLLLFRTE